MITIKHLLASAVLILFTAGSNAALFQLDVDSTTDLFSGFSVLFEDLDEDTLLSLDEIISFSGIECFLVICNDGNGFVYESVNQVPTIEGFTDGPNNNWGFFGPGSAIGIVNTAFTNYRLTPVPLPAALPMMLTALFVLRLFRTRSRNPF